MSRLSDPSQALGSERAYVRRALPLGVARDVRTSVAAGDPRGLVRAGAIVAGLALTVGGYATATARTRLKQHHGQPENTMQGHQMPASGWLNFDIHGKVGIRVAARAPGAPQLRAMLACFATDREVPADIVVSERPEPMPDAALLEHELAYTETAVRFVRERVQVVLEEDQYRVHGAGELLTSLVPRARPGDGQPRRGDDPRGDRRLPGPGDRAAGRRRHRQDQHRGQADAARGLDLHGRRLGLPLRRRPLLGYEKPMFIKPHHKAIYPHLFEGARKPLVPVRLSRRRRPGHDRRAPLRDPLPPGGRLRPAGGRPSTGWSPPRRRSPAASRPRARAAAASVYIERFEGARSRLVEKDPEWMVDRMLGNFHIEMAGFSQQVVTGMAASSVLPWSGWVEDKATVLLKALDGRPCHLLQVPSVYTPDEASDDIVEFLEELLPSFVGAQAA